MSDTIDDVIVQPYDHDNTDIFPTPMPSIDPNLSDLFFNYDHSDAIERDTGGAWAGYNLSKFRDTADNFIMSLSGLGVAAIDGIEPDDLIRDFLRRV